MQDMRDSGKTYVARKPIMQELSSWTLNQARISEYNLSSMILASYRLNSRFIWMIFVLYEIFTVHNCSCFLLYYAGILQMVQLYITYSINLRPHVISLESKLYKTVRFQIRTVYRVFENKNAKLKQTPYFGSENTFWRS